MFSHGVSPGNVELHTKRWNEQKNHPLYLQTVFRLVSQIKWLVSQIKGAVSQKKWVVSPRSTLVS